MALESIWRINKHAARTRLHKMESNPASYAARKLSLQRMLLGLGGYLGFCDLVISQLPVTGSSTYAKPVLAFAAAMFCAAGGTVSFLTTEEGVKEMAASLRKHVKTPVTPAVGSQHSTKSEEEPRSEE